jgi:putative tributyrin esterase
MSSSFRTIEVSDPRFESGGLRHITVKSPALRARADITVFVPEAAKSQKNVPLVILLHGVYGSHWAWALKGGVPGTVEHLIQQGKIPPCILVMPSDGLLGDGSGYLNRNEGDFERWIVDEVPLAVSEALKITEASSPKFLCGLSMGGFGALRLGAKYGARFQAVSGHSSITHLSQLKNFIEEPLELANFSPEETSVLAAILKHRHQLPALRFDCGRDDSLLEPNRVLHEELTRENIPHIYEEFSGAHQWSYWENHVKDSLLFFAAR